MRGKKDDKRGGQKNTVDFVINPEELKTLPKINNMLVTISTNDEELQPFLHETLKNFKMDTPVFYYPRADMIAIARERKDIETEDSDAIEPAKLANIMKNKMLENDYDAMLKRRKQAEDAAMRGEEGAAEIKAAQSAVDLFHLLSDFPISAQEIEALKEKNYNININLTILNTRPRLEVLPNDNVESQKDIYNGEQEGSAKQVERDIFPDNYNATSASLDNAKKFKETHLAQLTVQSELMKEYISSAKRRDLTMHKFNMDAEMDEHNVLQFDKDRIAQKLTEILNYVAKWFKDMHHYNNSSDIIQFNEIEKFQNVSIYNEYLNKLNKKNYEISVGNLIDAMMYYVDEYDSRKETDQTQEDLNNIADEIKLNSIIKNINNVDLINVIKTESKLTQSQKRNESSKFNYCEKKFKFKNKVFLDYNKMKLNLYDDAKSEKFFKYLEQLRIPGLNRLEMPAEPAEEFWNASRNSSWKTHFIKLSPESIGCFDHLTHLQSILDQYKENSHNFKLSQLILYEEYSTSVYAKKYLDLVSLGYKCKTKYLPAEDALLVVMLHESSDLNQTEQRLSKVTGKLSFLDYLLYQHLAQGKVYNLGADLQPLKHWTKSMYVDGHWAFKQVLNASGLNSSVLNICEAREILVWTDWDSVQIRLAQADVSLTIKSETVTYERIRRVKQEADSTDDDKEKAEENIVDSFDPAAVYLRKKQVDASQFYEKTADTSRTAVVANLRVGGKQVKLYPDGDMLVTQDDSTQARVYDSLNRIVTVDSQKLSRRTVYYENGDYEVQEGLQVELVKRYGSRMRQHIGETSQPLEAVPSEVEVDTESMAEVCALQDGRLVVSERNGVTTMLHADSTLIKSYPALRKWECKHPDFFKFVDYKAGGKDDQLVNLLLKLAYGESIQQLVLGPYDRALKGYDCVYRFARVHTSTDENGETSLTPYTAFLISIQSNLLYIGREGHTLVISRDSLQEFTEDALGRLLLVKHADRDDPHVVEVDFAASSIRTFDYHGNAYTLAQDECRVDYQTTPAEPTWDSRGEVSPYLNSEVDLPKSYYRIMSGDLLYRSQSAPVDPAHAQLNLDENPPKRLNQHPEMHVFVVDQRREKVREYCTRRQVSNFINSMSNPPKVEPVSRDLDRLSFLQEIMPIDWLREEIDQEIDQLPMVNRLKVYKKRLEYKQQDYSQRNPPLKVFVERKLNKFHSYDPQSREKYLEQLNLYNKWLEVKEMKSKPKQVLIE